MSIMCLCREAVIICTILLIPLTRIQATAITNAEGSLEDAAKFNLSKIPVKIDAKDNIIPEALNPNLMSNHHRRRKRYALTGVRIASTNLKWILATKNMTHRDEVRAIIKEATTYWSNHSELTFNETSDPVQADIEIHFVNSMRSVPNALAEAEGMGYLSYGAISVNENVNWSYLNKGDTNATSLLTVMVHELGHILGIQHSNDPKSIMLPSYNYNFSFTEPMSDDDLVAITKIYGKQEKEEPNICIAKYDAAFNMSNNLVLFLGKYVYSTASNDLRLIRDVFDWLPQNVTKIDAYYYDPEGFEYLFVGATIHVLNLIGEYIRIVFFSINLNSIGIHLKYDRVDAIFKYNGKIFIVSGDQYWIINETFDRVIESRNMSDFQGMDLPITTIFEYQTNETYVVRGNRYWRLDKNQTVLTAYQYSTKDLVCSSENRPKCCTLQSTDLEQAVYDPRTHFQFYGRNESTMGLNICVSNLDAVAVVNDDLVMFVGEYMYSRAMNEFMLIRDAYKHLPVNLTKVDAYYFDPKGYEYFFIGNEVYKFYQAELIQLSTENLSSIGFDSTIDHIDAVFKYNGSILAVSNDRYWTINDNWDPLMVQGPMNMTDFSIYSPITAAFEGLHRIIYFVFGNEFKKFYGDINKPDWGYQSTEYLVCTLEKKNILNPKCCTIKQLFG